MQILDGVIFASDWQDHMIVQGHNRRPVKRRQRPDGTYQYMELDEWNRTHGGVPQAAPGAGEVLTSGRIEDPTSRLIMADALMDSDREPEAEFLRGPRGDGAVRVGGRFRDPGDLPSAQLKVAVATAVAQSRLKAQIVSASPPHLPVGTVQVAAPSQTQGYDYLSASTLVAAARLAKETGHYRLMDAASAAQERRSFMNFQADPVSSGGVLRDRSAGLAWMDAHHAGRGDLVGSGVRTLRDGMQVQASIYRMPCNGNVSEGEPPIVYRHYAVLHERGGDRLYLPRAASGQPGESSRANLEQDLFHS